jgi:hypothetical protein
MEHLAECESPAARTYWKLVFNFIADVLKAGRPTMQKEAILFNMWAKNTLGSEAANAFIRHAFGVFYAAFTKVETEDRIFAPPLVFERTIINYRNAALRYGVTIKRFHAKRRHSTLVDTAPTSALTAFPELISFDPGNHSFLLHPGFKAAVANAETNANTYRMTRQPTQQPPRAQQQQNA